MIINAINSIPSPLLQILNTHIVDIILATILQCQKDSITTTHRVSRSWSQSWSWSRSWSWSQSWSCSWSWSRGPGHDLGLGRGCSHLGMLNGWLNRGSTAVEAKPNQPRFNWYGWTASWTVGWTAVEPWFVDLIYISSQSKSLYFVEPRFVK